MKTMMNEERARELQRYIKTLTDLQNGGFNCKNEIQVAIKALHEAMGFGEVSEKDRKPIHIVVFEDNFDGVVKSVEMFNRLLGNSAKTVRDIRGDNHEMRNANGVCVSILKVDKDTPSKIRGWRADYIINNSSHPDIAFGIHKK